MSKRVLVSELESGEEEGDIAKTAASILTDHQNSVLVVWAIWGREQQLTQLAPSATHQRTTTQPAATDISVDSSLLFLL